MLEEEEEEDDDEEEEEDDDDEADKDAVCWELFDGARGCERDLSLVTAVRLKKT